MLRGEQIFRSAAECFAAEQNLYVKVQNTVGGLRVEFTSLPDEEGKRLFMASTLSWLEVRLCTAGIADALKAAWTKTWLARAEWKRAPDNKETS